MIRTADGKVFREFVLFCHDFALLFDQDGNPINPPEVLAPTTTPESWGITAVSPCRSGWRKDDPSHIFSSWVYGDPATPILETYPESRCEFVF